MEIKEEAEVRDSEGNLGGFRCMTCGKITTKSRLEMLDNWILEPSGTLICPKCAEFKRQNPRPGDSLRWPSR